MGKEKIYKPDISLGIQLWQTPSGGMSYLKNMTLENGVAKKRRGWRTLFNFRGYSYEPHRINGIYEYRGRDGAYLIVHAYKSLYRCGYDFKDIEKIPCRADVVLADSRSRGQMYGGVLWIVGMGEPLIYDGQEVKTVKNKEWCHVPVTACGIRDMKLGLPYEQKEAPSILTDRRINTAQGKKDELIVHRFLLDAPVKYGTPLKIKASFRVRTSTEEANELTTNYIGVLEDGTEINTVVSVELYTDSVENGGEIVSREKPVDKLGRRVSIGDGFVFLGYVYNGNEVYLAFDAAAYESGVDNVEVEFTADTEERSLLGGARDACTVSLSEGGDALALATDAGKLLIGTLTDKGFYFPTDGTVAVGSSAEPITAVLPREQSALAVYKGNGFYVLSLDGEKGAELLPSPEMLGCFCPFSAVRQRDECLALSIEGVFGIKDSSSKTNVSTYQKMRSRGIQAELDRIPIPTLEGGCVCVHKGRYYLFLNDRAYVMQRGDGDEPAWWRLDNCAARVALSADGRLYMGRENGDIAVFDEGYTDRRDYVLNERERDFLFQNFDGKSVLSLNYAIGVKEGDKLYLDEHYALWSRCILDCKTNIISLSSVDCHENGIYVGPCQGQGVLLCDTDGYVVYEGEICDFNPSACTVHCGSLGQSRDTELLMYVKRDRQTEYTYRVQEGLGCLYCNGRALTLYDTDVERLYVRQEQEIECELYTPVVNLGENGQKSLVGIAVTFSPETRSTVGVGYETGKGFFERVLTLGAKMDFGSLDFNDIKFMPEFKRTLKLRCLERNIDYARLWIRSQGGGELGVEGVSMIYT